MSAPAVPPSGLDRPAGKRIGSACLDYPVQGTGDGWFLVRALGHELHLRHVVSAGSSGEEQVIRADQPHIRRAVQLAEDTSAAGWRLG